MNSDPVVVSVDRSSEFSISDPVFFNFTLDGLYEGTECLIVVLSVNETELDPQDQGQVEISDDVALVRILDGDIGKQCLYVYQCKLFALDFLYKILLLYKSSLFRVLIYSYIEFTK